MNQLEKDIQRARRNVVGDWIRMSCNKWPRKTALVFGKNHISYQEVNEKANRIANGMLKMGIKKGDVVAILSHNCPEYVYFIWASAKIGAIITLVNYSFKPKEIEEQVKDSDAKMLIVEDCLLKEVLEIKDKLTAIDIFCVINIKENTVPDNWMKFEHFYSYPDSEPEIDQNGEDVIALLYTSGTTGVIKGCMHTNNSIYAAWQNTESPYGWNIGQEDTVLLPAPLYTSTGYLMLALSALRSGATYVMTYLPRPRDILELIEREKCTMVGFPPTLWIGLLNEVLQGQRKYDLSSIKKAAWFGDPMNLDVWEKWLQILPGDVLYSPGCSLTETGVNGFSYWGRTFPSSGSVIGLPHKNIDIRIVDENDEDVPDGVPGELVVRGPSLMKGYYKKDDLNRVTFKNGWLHTGDVIVRKEDGLYYFYDRKKDLVKSGGQNVSCREVEELLNSHPKVQASAVFGVPHDYWAEAVVAAVIVKQNEKLTEEEIIEYCRPRIAGYKIPKKVVFVDSFPVSSLGKVLKRALKEKYAAIFRKEG